MNITAKEIKDVIQTEDDFGHEMRVGNILGSIGQSGDHSRPLVSHIEKIDHGGTYIDSVTDKPRQFDFRCCIRYGRGYPQNNERRILLAVECKNLHESSPLVVCGRNRTDEEAFHQLILSAAKGANASVYQIDGQSSLYVPGHFVGKSLIRLKRDSNGKLKTDTQGDLYDRWSQAVASCRELAQDACSFGLSIDCEHFLTFVMPIVVIPNGLLWKVEYNSSGTATSPPKNVNECHFFIGSPIGVTSPPIVAGAPARTLPLKLTHLHFVTLDGFVELLLDFHRSPGRAWETIFSRAASAVSP